MPWADLLMPGSCAPETRFVDAAGVGAGADAGAQSSGGWRLDRGRGVQLLLRADGCDIGEGRTWEIRCRAGCVTHKTLGTAVTHVACVVGSRSLRQLLRTDGEGIKEVVRAALLRPDRGFDDLLRLVTNEPESYGGPESDTELERQSDRSRCVHHPLWVGLLPRQILT